MKNDISKDIYNSVRGMIRSGVRMLPAAALLTAPAMAFAQVRISDLSSGWKAEATAILPVVMLLIAAIGIAVAGTAVLSGISAKRNQRPLEWQVWGVIGGALAVIIPLVILATAGTITDGRGDADGVMGDLGL